MTTPKSPARRMSSDDVAVMLDVGDVLLLDVREPNEIAELGTLPGYLNIPFPQLEAGLHELPQDRRIITA